MFFYAVMSSCSMSLLDFALLYPNEYCISILHWRTENGTILHSRRELRGTETLYSRRPSVIGNWYAELKKTRRGLKVQQYLST